MQVKSADQIIIGGIFDGWSFIPDIMYLLHGYVFCALSTACPMYDVRHQGTLPYLVSTVCWFLPWFLLSTAVKWLKLLACNVLFYHLASEIEITHQLDL